MAQLAIDGFGTIEDQIEKAAAQYGVIEDIADFAKWCRRRGYLSDLSMDDAVVLGDVFFIKERILKKREGGLRKWICTGEGKGAGWISRRLCTADQHLEYCRLLKKKRDDIDGVLQLELDFRRDREWGFVTEDCL